MSRALAFTLLVATGCVASNSGNSFFVVDDSAPPIGMCTFTGQLGQMTQPSGIINTASTAAGYVFNPLLQSQVSVLMNQDPTLKTISIEGAYVDLVYKSITETGAAGVITTLSPTIDYSLQHFQVLTSGTLQPAITGMVGGTANVSLELVPPAAIQQVQVGADLTQSFRALIQATVTFHGKLANSEILATPFEYGVTVCNQCVVNILGNCPSTGVTPRVGNACNPFQDGVVDCCKETTGALTCPARTM